MTTVEQWTEITEWVTDRFPNKPWAAEQALAYFYDLEDYDASHVWAGLHSLYEKGQAFAPNGSQLLAKTIEESRLAARDDMYRTALPEPPRKPMTSGEPSYAVRRYGEDMRGATGTQLIERIHNDLPAVKCGNKRCDMHHDEGAK